MGHSLGKLFATHARHSDVGDHQFDQVTSSLEQGKRFSPADGHDDAVPASDKNPLDVMPNQFFIIYHEDHSASDRLRH